MRWAWPAVALAAVAALLWPSTAATGPIAHGPVNSTPSVDSQGDSWRPNLRIGPIVFNKRLPADVEVIRRRKSGLFAVRTSSGAVVRGVLFADPNNLPSPSARAIWTRSKQIEYRGVSVGDRWRRAKSKLGKRFKKVRTRRCSWLNSYKVRGRTGPVSTQLYFSRRTGRITRIALNEITEDIGCPR